jgi:hypothetical protein
MGRKWRVLDAVFIVAFAALLVRGLVRESWWEVGLAALWLVSSTLSFFGKFPQGSYHPTTDMSKSGIQRWRARRRSQGT